MLPEHTSGSSSHLRSFSAPMGENSSAGSPALTDESDADAIKTAAQFESTNSRTGEVNP